MFLDCCTSLMGSRGLSWFTARGPPAPSPLTTPLSPWTTSSRDSPYSSAAPWALAGVCVCVCVCVCVSVCVCVCMRVCVCEGELDCWIRQGLLLPSQLCAHRHSKGFGGNFRIYLPRGGKLTLVSKVYNVTTINMNMPLIMTRLSSLETLLE